MATVNVTSNINLESLTYVADDDLVIFDGVTLTITQTPSRKVRSITSTGSGTCELVNTSTSTMLLLSTTAGQSNSLRFENAATFRTRGNWITAYTGTGASNQTVLSNLTIGGQTIDYPTYMRVESGSGTNVWQIWVVVPEDVAGWTANDLGFNEDHYRAGTVAISAAGVVTGTGTNFDGSYMISRHFRATGHSTDYIVSVVNSTTSLQLTNRDGSAYSGGAISAGTSYLIRTGSAMNLLEFGSGELGRVLFFNPLTNTVRCNDGTNGNAIPTGARVQVPNIHITSDILQTTLASAITGTSAAAITLASSTGFPASITQYTSNSSQSPTLLIRNGSAIERIGWTSRSGATISATGQFRGAFQTVAQTFPVGSTVTYIPHANNNSGVGGFDLNAGGFLDTEITSYGPRFAGWSTNQARQVRMVDTGVMGRSQVVTCTGNVELTRVCGGPDFRSNGNSATGSSHGVSTISGTVNATDCVFAVHCQLITSTTAVITFSNAQQLQSVTDCYFIALRKAASAGSSGIWTNFSSIAPISIIRPRVIGFSARLTVSPGAFFRDLRYADTTGDAIGYIESSPIVIAAQSGGGVVGFSVISGGWPPRDAPLNVGSDCTSNILSNKGYPAIDGRGSTRRPMSANNGANTIYSHWTIINARGTQPIVVAGNVSNTGGAYRKIDFRGYATALTTTGRGPQLCSGTIVDVLVGPQPYWSNTLSTSLTFSLTDIQPIGVYTDATTTTGGNCCVGPFSLQGSLDMYSGLSGTAYLNGDGRLLLTGAADQVIVKSTAPLRGIQSFDTTGTITNEGVNTGTLSFEFRMVNWGDDVTVATWQSLTLSNLETRRSALTGYSSATGVNLQVRITSSGADTSRLLTLIRLPIVLDATYNPAVSTIPITITNAVSGSVYRLYNNTVPASPVLIGRTTVSGTTASIQAPTDYDETVTPITIRVIDYLYNRIKVDSSYVYTALSIPVSPSLDTSVTETNRATVEAYTTANTLERVRDLVKSWTADNFELNWPGIDTSIATVNGTTLDFGSINLVFDGSASAVRTVNTSTNTITFKTTAALTGTKFNRIKTTGTITFSNGADYSVIVEDSSGLRYPAITVTGFPTASNENGVAPNAVVGIYAVDSATWFTADASSGTVSKKLTEVGASTTYRVVGDAVGWIRTPFVTISSNYSGTLDLSNLFQEFLAEDGSAIVGKAAPTGAVGFNTVDLRFTLGAVAFSFYALAHDKELLTSTQTALVNYDTSLIRRIEFIENQAYKRIIIPAPLKVAAASTAATSPIFTDFSVLRDDGADPYEHGLTSTAPGLTTRPEIVIAFQSPAEGVTITSLATNAITAASIASDAVTKVQTGLATAGSVAAIPTNPVLATDGRLNNLNATISSRSTFDPTSQTVVVGTNNDKLDYSLSVSAENSLVSKVWTATTRSLTTLGTVVSDTAAAVWAAATRTLTSIDKNGYSLTNGERTSIAQVVETQLADDFANATTNLTPVLTAISGLNNISTAQVRTQVDAALTAYDAVVPADLPTVPTTAQIADAVEAKLADEFAAIPDTAEIAAAVNLSLADDFAGVTVDLTPVTDAIADLNDLSATQVRAQVDAALVSYDVTVPADLVPILTAIAALPAPDNTTIGQIKAKVDQITISSGGVVATLNGETVTLPTDVTTRLLELWQLQGLDASSPMSVSSTNRNTGSITLTISESNGTVTVTRT